MKNLIKFALILIVGIILGYVFHNPIDTKLKARFGNTIVEKGKAKVEELGEKTVVVSKAMTDAGKKELDKSKGD
jgi:Flp pilus assembly protein CpaB